MAGDLKKDLKILQICAAYKPAFVYGGPTMSVAKLSEELVKAGISVQAFATTANGKTELPVTPGVMTIVDGVEVIYFKRLTKDHSHFSPSLLRRLWKDVKKYDLIHIHAWWNLVSLLSAMIGLIRRVPVLVSPRGTLSPYSFNNKNIGIKWLIHHLIGKHLLIKSHFHVTSARESDASIMLVKPMSITSIPNFVNIPRTPSEQNKNVNGIFRLLFFSRIEEKKGLEILLNALPQLKVPYRLIIAGDGESAYIDSLKARAQSNDVDKNIEWAGFRGADKFMLLGGNDLLILPSYDENFGNVVIESLSEGTAVLLSPFVGLIAYVKKNNFGWECALDAASVSHMIDYIYSKPAELALIRQNAPAKIRADFDEQNLAKLYINMYKKIING